MSLLTYTYIYIYIELSTAMRFELAFITKHYVSRFHRSSVVKRKLTDFTKQFCDFLRWKYCRFSCIELQLKQLWDRKKMNKKNPIDQQYLQTLERRCFALCRHFAISSFRWFSESSPSFIKIVVFSRLHSWQHFDSGVYADALPTIDQCTSYLVLSALSCQM